MLFAKVLEISESRNKSGCTSGQKKQRKQQNTLYLAQELIENAKDQLTEAQKVMTIHVINNVRVPIYNRHIIE